MYGFLKIMFLNLFPITRAPGQLLLLFIRVHKDEFINFDFC